MCIFHWIRRKTLGPITTVFSAQLINTTLIRFVNKWTPTSIQQTRYCVLLELNTKRALIMVVIVYIVCKASDVFMVSHGGNLGVTIHVHTLRFRLVSKVNFSGCFTYTFLKQGKGIEKLILQGHKPYAYEQNQKLITNITPNIRHMLTFSLNTSMTEHRIWEDDKNNYTGNL